MKKKVSITLDADIVNKLEKMCEKEDRTISNMINMLLKRILNEKSN